MWEGFGVVEMTGTTVETWLSSTEFWVVSKVDPAGQQTPGVNRLLKHKD